MSSGTYHSVTCWAVDCDGIGCDCWCHDDDAGTPAAQHNTQDNATDVRYNRDGPDGCVNTSRGLTTTPDMEVRG